uniref:Cytochrome P450 n=1 Tax=Timema cristinae TaxID=61476 RepID=A0A7R9DAK4_TIMCR|nr:unnamed protein product [Timema cristinae]
MTVEIISVTSGCHDNHNLMHSFKFGRYDRLPDSHPYSEQSLLSHAATLFVEGYETSSIVMSYTLFELAVNPDIQERVRAEIEESKGEMTLETISKMSYLDKVLSEVMRKYPVTSTMAKVCTKPCQLKSPSGLTCDVEVGTSVIIPILALHHDPKHYPDPERFYPERFNEENIAKRHRFAYLPFGEGPRICIGKGKKGLGTLVLVVTFRAREVVALLVAVLPEIFSSSPSLPSEIYDVTNKNHTS